LKTNSYSYKYWGKRNGNLGTEQQLTDEWLPPAAYSKSLDDTTPTI
jgi:hypothetical protein